MGVTGQALALVTGEDTGVMDRVRELQRLVGELEKNDPAAREWTAGLETAVVELEDLSRELERYLGEIELDPEQASGLEERVDLLESLKRKYGPTLGDVVESGARAAERLGAVENRGELLEELEAEAKSARQAVVEAGAVLTGKRRKAAPRLAKEIRRHLAELGFKQAAFEVNLEPQAGTVRDRIGECRVRFRTQSGGTAQAATADCLQRGNLPRDAVDQERPRQAGPHAADGF